MFAFWETVNWCNKNSKRKAESIYIYLHRKWIFERYPNFTSSRYVSIWEKRGMGLKLGLESSQLRINNWLWKMTQQLRNVIQRTRIRFSLSTRDGSLLLVLQLHGMLNPFDLQGPKHKNAFTYIHTYAHINIKWL